MDLKQTTQAATWIWNGIKNCYDSLRNGICIRIGQNSTAPIFEDTGYRVYPTSLCHRRSKLQIIFFFVRDLMNAEKKDWNPNVIMNNFPKSICRHILSIPISQQEQDTFVWAPSKLGAFSVRSSYRLNNKGRFDSMDDTTRKLWKGL